MEKVKNIQSMLYKVATWRPFLFAVGSAADCPTTARKKKHQKERSIIKYFIFLYINKYYPIL